ncbi:MAG: thioredoxin family protein [Oscillospiraceae bacterium]|nr:thioredoxin family protein [Oscillospiraceae bacterium]
MEKITMFLMEGCRYCHQALRFIDDLYETDERYRNIPLEKIDENKYPEIADKYGYYFVPTFYVGEKKEHEGAVNLETVRRVFEKALNS